MKRISSTLASRGLGLYVLLPLQFCRKKILIRLEKEKFHFFPKKKKKTSIENKSVGLFHAKEQCTIFILLRKMTT